MSPQFRAVHWNRTKLVYDGVVLAGVALYLGTFLFVGPLLWPTDHPVTWEILRIRAFGTCAFLMLTVILAIGPLARLDRRFLPLLYNRRHFGVITFLVAAHHAGFVLDWYHGQGRLPMLVSVLIGNRHYGSFIGFPFEALGVVGLAVLFLMAATSHDFWLGFLTPPVWKALHMAVYVAYGLLAMHVALGVMQTERNPLIPALLAAAFAAVAALHLLAGRREAAADPRGARHPEGWIAIGPPRSVPDGGARVVAVPAGERIAIFRDGTRFRAFTNLCAHQNGPLGEGRVVDGCVTCPWHGFQYRLEDGCSPPPFAERISSYPLRLRHGLLEVRPSAFALGSTEGLLTLAEGDRDG